MHCLRLLAIGSFRLVYSKTWSKTQAGSKQQTGITQARQGVIVGQASVFDRRTISRGPEKRGSPII